MLWHVLDALQITVGVRLEPLDDLLAPENMALRCSASVVQIMQVPYGSVPRGESEREDVHERRYVLSALSSSRSCSALADPVKKHNYA